MQRELELRGLWCECASWAQCWTDVVGLAASQAIGPGWAAKDYGTSLLRSGRRG